MSNLKIILIFILISLITSCNKKTGENFLGLDVQPENDLLGVTISDTSTLMMFTQKVDFVKSYNDQIKFLGSTLNPVFGRTDASIYTNFSIANNLTNLSFGANPILDSAEIVIRWLGQAVGDTSTLLTYNIYALTENVKPTNATHNNFTNSVLTKSNTPVCSAQVRYRTRGNGLCLVLKLDQAFAQYILQTDLNLTNNTAFINAYKGFYITTENTALNAPTQGAIRRFDLDDILSGANFYYKENNAVGTLQKIFQFTFKGSDAARFNNVNHNNYTTAAQNLVDQLNGNILKGETNLYLNSFGGTRIRLTLPYLSNFSANQNVSINRAELILKVDESVYDPKYAYPPNLALIFDSLGTGREELVFDQIETTDFIKYNGNYDAVNKQYVFNVARQVQKIITNKIKNNGFFIVNAQPNRSFVIRRDDRFNYVTFGGKTNNLFKPKFKITYISYPYDK